FRQAHFALIRKHLVIVDDSHHSVQFAFAPGRHFPVAPRICGNYLIRGSCSHWWYGGGEDSCHSRVVAPSPHGLSPARRFLEKASKTPYRKIPTANAEIYDPIEET